MAEILLCSTEVFFRPTCLVCRSASSQLLCHRCELPLAAPQNKTLVVKFATRELYLGIFVIYANNSHHYMKTLDFFGIIAAMHETSALLLNIDLL